MAVLSFTFDFRNAGHLLSQIDGQATIGVDGIEEVSLEDLDTSRFEPVGGDLERDVRLFLTTHPEHAQTIDQMVEDECAGRTSYDRETARAMVLSSANRASLATMQPLFAALTKLTRTAAE